MPDSSPDDRAPDDPVSDEGPTLPGLPGEAPTEALAGPPATENAVWTADAEPAEAADPVEIAEPVEVAPAPAAAPARGVRHFLLAGLVGGLVGALVASGVFVALDDSDGTSASSTQATPVVVRPSKQIARKGDVAAILQTAVPAVVAIVDDGGPDSGGAAGTGFVISPDGVIVTNNHVVEGANQIQAVFSDGTTKRATVLGRNAASDLAVIKVDGSGLATIGLGDSGQVQVGDDVIAIGNALALEGGLSVTRGIVSGLHREVGTNAGDSLEDVIQTDAAINPGNSGGPLVDSAGRVIGINTAIADPTSAQNVGFAIPISNARTIIEQLRQGKQPAYLGVNSQNIDAAKADGHDVSVSSGAYVAKVFAGTPAADAGIRAGDVIVSIDGKAVSSAADLGNLVRQYRPGDEVDVVLDRDGKSVTVTAKLGEAPSS